MTLWEKCALVGGLAFGYFVLIVALAGVAYAIVRVFGFGADQKSK